MAKLVILFGMLLTLQGSYQLPSGSAKLNELEEVVEEFALALKDVNEIIAFVAGHLSSVARDYEHKIYDTLTDRNILSLIYNHQDAIHEVESSTNGNSKTCIDGAWRQTMVATTELKRGVDSCIADARVVGAEIQGSLEAIDGKALTLQSELTIGFHNCITDENEDKIKCLRNVIGPIKEKVEIVDQQVTDTHEVVHKKIEDGIKNLNICLQNKEHDFSLKSDSILKNLNECVKDGSGSFIKITPKGIIDIIKEIKEKIQYIMHILSHLPTSIEEISEKINEIIAHINISGLLSQLKAEIDQIIDNGGSNAESCRPKANEGIDALTESSETAGNKCLEETESKVDKIKEQIAALKDEGTNILEDIKNQTHQCFLENKFNPVKFYKCLEDHVDEFQERVTDLQQKVVDTYEHAKDQADDIVQDLAGCMNKVQIDTIKQGQVLIDDVETCIRFSNSKYFMK